MIYTFYSYKGGVGRSMALANIAEWLFMQGARVIIVDWDLEAPGIERFFYQSETDLNRVQERLGLIDLLMNYKRQFDRNARTNPDIEPREVFDRVLSSLPPLVEYLHSVQTPVSEKASALWLLMAGARTGGDLSAYAEAVQDFNWVEFYRIYEGEAYFDWFRNQLTSLADAVFIDSRTGITEMGGVCTRHLADVVVEFTAPNTQNLQGTIYMAESFRRKEVLEARNGKPEVVLVPSRVESAELDSRNRFKDLFQIAEQRFLPPVFRSLNSSFWDLQIPYVPKFSYDEALAVGGPPSAKLIEAEEMATAYRRLAAHLTLLTPTENQLRIINAEDLNQFVSTIPAPSRADKVWRSVFISYAREDGQQLAAMIRERLQREAPDMAIWQDIERIEAGANWAEQIKKAITSVETVIVVLTTAALASKWIIRELDLARRHGIRIFPVTGNIDLGSLAERLPAWLRKRHVIELKQGWELLLQQLRVPYQKVPVPFMAPEKSDSYVERPNLHHRVRELLLSSDRQIGTVVLIGPGGSGKTVLAVAMCHDEHVRSEFEDGVLWARVGGDIDGTSSLSAMYWELTGERLSFYDPETASFNLARALEGKRCLLVLDDVLESSRLEPFLRGGHDCVRLVTSRRPDVAAGAAVVEVESMEQKEAAQMIGSNDLADLLGRWPLALHLAKTLIIERVRRGESFDQAIQWFKEALERRGLSLLSPLASIINTSIQALTLDSRRRLVALAELGESPVSLREAAELWDIDEFDTEDLVRELERQSLVTLNLGSRTVKVHDIVRKYLSGPTVREKKG